MTIAEFELSIDTQQPYYDLQVPAGTLIVDAEPRYGRETHPVKLHVLGEIEDSAAPEIRRFALLGIEETVPHGWSEITRFSGRQLVMLDKPLQRRHGDSSDPEVGPWNRCRPTDSG